MDLNGFSPGKMKTQSVSSQKTLSKWRFTLGPDGASHGSGTFMTALFRSVGGVPIEGRQFKEDTS